MRNMSSDLLSMCCKRMFLMLVRTHNNYGIVCAYVYVS